MKPKLECSNQNFHKGKEIVTEIYQKLGGKLVLNVEPYFDNSGTKEKELFFDSFKISLPNKIELFIFFENEKVSGQLNLRDAELDDKTKSIINEIKRILSNHESHLV